MLDFIRIACAVPAVKVGDVAKNTRDICAYMDKANDAGADIVLFPELALTGYSCGDLFFQDSLHRAVKEGLRQIADHSAETKGLTTVVGLPVCLGHKLYNCAAVISGGQVCGIVPKTYLTAAEKRWFASADQLGQKFVLPQDLGLASSQDYWDVPVCAKQLFRMAEDAMLGIEICQDAMGPQTCSASLAVNGAEVILNLSASHELAGKRAKRRGLVQHLSSSCACIYAFASAGYTESTADLVRYALRAMVMKG